MILVTTFLVQVTAYDYTCFNVVRFASNISAYLFEHSRLLAAKLVFQDYTYPVLVYGIPEYVLCHISSETAI